MNEHTKTEKNDRKFRNIFKQKEYQNTLVPEYFLLNFLIKLTQFEIIGSMKLSINPMSIKNIKFLETRSYIYAPRYLYYFIGEPNFLSLGRRIRIELKKIINQILA